MDTNLSHRRRNGGGSGPSTFQTGAWPLNFWPLNFFDRPVLK